eukprot:maker-scaffold_29-snap-gene-1.5-mRNA-1 protein AED:0.35 eAED:0.35 QI:0/0/0/1/1/1/2/0/1215
MSFPSLLDSTIQVIARPRPLNEKEKKQNTTPCLTTDSSASQVTLFKGVGKKSSKHVFQLNKVLNTFTTQQDVFKEVIIPVLDDVSNGLEATVFAYGQTGTGKTYTMEGNFLDDVEKGIIPRVLEHLFSVHGQIEVKLSFLEIYNEDLTDLLVPEKGSGPTLRILNGECVGLTRVKLEFAEELKQLLQKAAERRKTAETKMNTRSSRSHCICSIHAKIMESMTSTRPNATPKKLIKKGILHLVDLAGSESSNAHSPGQTARKIESGNINQSLLTLGRVITALKEKHSRVPYRDSKLTRLLQNAIGGASKTKVILTLSPSVLAVEESLSTLKFGQSAYGLKNKKLKQNVKVALDGLNSGSGGDSEKFHGSDQQNFRELEMKLEYIDSQLREAQTSLGFKVLQVKELEVVNQTLTEENKSLNATRAQLESEVNRLETLEEALRQKMELIQERIVSCKISIKSKQREIVREQGASLQRSETFLDKKALIGDQILDASDYRFTNGQELEQLGRTEMMDQLGIIFQNSSEMLSQVLELKEVRKNLLEKLSELSNNSVAASDKQVGGFEKETQQVLSDLINEERNNREFIKSSIESQLIEIATNAEETKALNSKVRSLTSSYMKVIEQYTKNSKNVIRLQEEAVGKALERNLYILKNMESLKQAQNSKAEVNSSFFNESMSLSDNNITKNIDVAKNLEVVAESKLKELVDIMQNYEKAHFQRIDSLDGKLINKEEFLREVQKKISSKVSCFSEESTNNLSDVKHALVATSTDQDTFLENIRKDSTEAQASVVIGTTSNDSISSKRDSIDQRLSNILTMVSEFSAKITSEVNAARDDIRTIKTENDVLGDTLEKTHGKIETIEKLCSSSVEQTNSCLFQNIEVLKQQMQHVSSTNKFVKKETSNIENVTNEIGEIRCEVQQEQKYKSSETSSFKQSIESIGSHVKCIASEMNGLTEKQKEVVERLKELEEERRQLLLSFNSEIDSTTKAQDDVLQHIKASQETLETTNRRVSELEKHKTGFVREEKSAQENCAEHVEKAKKSQEKFLREFSSQSINSFAVRGELVEKVRSNVVVLKNENSDLQSKFFENTASCLKSLYTNEEEVEQKLTSCSKSQEEYRTNTTSCLEQFIARNSKARVTYLDNFKKQFAAFQELVTSEFEANSACTGSTLKYTKAMSEDLELLNSSNDKENAQIDNIEVLEGTTTVTKPKSFLSKPTTRSSKA